MHKDKGGGVCLVNLSLSSDASDATCALLEIISKIYLTSLLNIVWARDVFEICAVELYQNQKFVKKSYFDSVIPHGLGYRPCKLGPKRIYLKAQLSKP